MTENTTTARAEALRAEFARLLKQPRRQALKHSEALNVLAKIDGLRNHHVRPTDEDGSIPNDAPGAREATPVAGDPERDALRALVARLAYSAEPINDMIAAARAMTPRQVAIAPERDGAHDNDTPSDAERIADLTGTLKHYRRRCRKLEGRLHDMLSAYGVSLAPPDAKTGLVPGILAFADHHLLTKFKLTQASDDELTNLRQLKRLDETPESAERAFDTLFRWIASDPDTSSTAPNGANTCKKAGITAFASTTPTGDVTRLLHGQGISVVFRPALQGFGRSKRIEFTPDGVVFRLFEEAWIATQGG